VSPCKLSEKNFEKFAIRGRFCKKCENCSKFRGKCLRHKSELEYQNGWTHWARFWHKGAIYPTLCWKVIRIFPKIRVLTGGILSRTLNLENFAAARRTLLSTKARFTLATMSKVACCFDNVAVFGNKVERCFNIVAGVDRALGRRSDKPTVVDRQFITLSVHAPLCTTRWAWGSASRGSVSGSWDSYNFIQSTVCSLAQIFFVVNDDKENFRGRKLD